MGLFFLSGTYFLASPNDVVVLLKEGAVTKKASLRILLANCCVRDFAF